ncbi:hypothetical protein LguiA_011505 [Lonicera macranthoides]
MKEGLRSSTLSKRIKDSFDLSSKNRNDATVGEYEYVECVKGTGAGINYSEADSDGSRGKLGKSRRRGRKRKNAASPENVDYAISKADREKIGSSMVSRDSFSANDLVLSEREVEVGIQVEDMECSQKADVGLAVFVNANTVTHKDRHELGNGHEVRNKENVESPEKGDDATIDNSDEEKIYSHLISKYSDPAEDLAISSPEGKAEARSGTTTVQFNKEAGVCVEQGVSAIMDLKTDANNESDTSNLGESQQGIKRKKAEIPKKDETAISVADAEKIELSLIPNCLDPDNGLVISSPGRHIEDQSGTQPLKCSKYTDAGVENNASGKGDTMIEAGYEKDTSNGETPSDPSKDFVISSLEGKLEGGSGQEHVDRSKDASFGAEVGGIAKGTDFDIDKDASKLGKPPSDPAEGSVPSSPTREVKEGSCTECIECNKDANVHVEVGINAKDHALTDSCSQIDTNKLGKPRRGRKRKKVKSPKKGDFAIVEVKEERGSPLSCCDQDAVKHSVAFTLERKVKEEISEFEECKDADFGIVVGFNADGDANASIDAGKATDKQIKGRRGRKRKKVESYDCNEVDLAGRKKAKDVEVQIIGRVLRSRTMAMSGGEKVFESGSNGNPVHGKIKNEPDQAEQGGIETESDKSLRPTRRPRKNIKGRRGRPPKEKGKNGVSEVICKKKLKVMGSKKIGRDVSKVYKFPNACNKTVASKLISYNKPEVNGSKKQFETKKHKTERGMSRSEQQQLVRDQIVSILMKAGWTIEHRPRQNKDYLDAVYVDREGKTHWSVTLAYMKLKQKVEDGVADSQTISAYTPIPKEVLSILLRVRRVKKKRGKKDKADKEIPGKESSQNKPATKSISGSKRKNTQNSTLRAGVELSKIRKKRARRAGVESGVELSKTRKKCTIRAGVESSKMKKKGHTLHRKHQSGMSSHGGKPRWNREERLSRKPMALLARSSEKGLGSDVDGFIAYNGKRSLLSWMIDLGTVLPGWKVKYMNPRKTRVMVEGRITRDGIHCGCCDEILGMSDFESHSGSTRCQPFYNIYLESGISLLQCLADSWSKQVESDHIGFHFVDFDGDDPNDDTCNICGDGGDLICCDGCPSTFHQNCLNIENFPSGDWRCVYCSCKFCGTVTGNTSPRNDCNEVICELLTCHLCEEKFHITCSQVKDAINANSKCQSFCGRKCQELFEHLQALLGVKHELEEGFSWTLLQRCDVSQDISLSGAPLKVESNSKLAVAFSIMDECFVPIVDERSGTNMIHNVVYSSGSNIRRLNYSSFVTAILERGDEIISAASIRIHGNQLAEMPFIGTRHVYRRQGMCSRLLNAIESALCSLDVEKLVIPAISELLQTWTSVFGFEPLEEAKRQEMKRMSMVVFPGTDMLQKPLLKNWFDKGNPIPASGLKVIALGTDHETMPEEGPGNDSPEVIVQHACGSNDETANDASLDHLTHDNKLVIVSEGPASVSSELDGQQAREGINNGTNAQSDSTTSGAIVLGESAANDISHGYPINIHGNKLVKVSEDFAGVSSELDGHQAPKRIDKCTNSRSGSNGSGAVILVKSAANDTTLDHLSVAHDKKSSHVSQSGSDAANYEAKTTQIADDSNESVDCEQTRKAKCFQNDCNSLDEASIHHSACILSSHKTSQDAANDRDTPFETHDAEVGGPVDSKQLPSVAAIPDSTLETSSKASFMRNGLCESLELQCGVDNDDITLCKVTTNTVHGPKDDSAAQTSIHFNNGYSHEEFNSGSQVDHISATLRGTELLCNSSCTSSSFTSCSVPEVVGSCRLLKSGNPC